MTDTKKQTQAAAVGVEVDDDMRFISCDIVSVPEGTTNEQLTEMGLGYILRVEKRTGEPVYAPKEGERKADGGDVIYDHTPVDNIKKEKQR